MKNVVCVYPYDDLLPLLMNYSRVKPRSYLIKIQIIRFSWMNIFKSIKKQPTYIETMICSISENPKRLNILGIKPNSTSLLLIYCCCRTYITRTTSRAYS